ncbi:MAG: polymer-forming cytoskeletal protein [Treponema sp.]|nr:polymer-forming cytoskeletal protein [Treponema sp.]MCL2191149.1 polymer-forming cytoskeletal protein [Treponema sp.]
MANVNTDIMDDDDFDTILSRDIDFSGTVSFEEPLLIRGNVSGDIDAKGLLVVDEGAVVNAGIRTSRIVIRGLVKGDVSASEKVELAGTGRLEGDITTPEISMETGCVFNGRCSMVAREGST